MASRFSLVIFFAFSISIISATTTTSSNTISEPLLSACRLTLEPETCLKYLSMFPNGLTENIHNITALSLSASSFLAKEIYAFISLLKEEVPFAIPTYKHCLKGSEVAIKDIVQRLEDLTEALRNRSFVEVSIWISEAWTDAVNAEKICMGHNGKPKIPQLSNLMNDLRQMLRVISALFKLDANTIIP